MKKPRYMEELLGIIFLWLGIAFAAMGLLCFVGVLKPKTGSMIQVPAVLGIVYLLLGIGLVLVQIILKAVASSKDRLHHELLANGIRINGTVEKIYLQRYTQYGHKSPYRLCYSYISQGKIYHQKSWLLWERPDVMEHDAITVYTDNAGKSTISL